MRRLLLLLPSVFIMLISLAQVQKAGIPSGNISTATINRTPATGVMADSVITDIAAMFDQMEQSIEVEFVILKKETNDNIGHLQDKIKQIDLQIENVKRQVQKLDLIAGKIDQVLPRIMQELDSIKRTPAGILFPGQTQIAALQKTIDSLKSEKAAISTKRFNINNQISNLSAQKIAIQQQIKELEKELVYLDNQKQVLLAELRKQKEKAIAEAVKQKEQNPQRYQDVFETIQAAFSNMVQDSLRNISQRQMRIR
jgi:chromosome segregation ATPase